MNLNLELLISGACPAPHLPPGGILRGAATLRSSLIARPAPTVAVCPPIVGHYSASLGRPSPRSGSLTEKKYPEPSARAQFGILFPHKWGS